MKKKLDWSFYVKLIILVVGGFFIASFAFSKWSFKFDYQKLARRKKSRMTMPLMPIRTHIMSLNTISLLFLLLSINEYRANEFMSPNGVDPDKIPDNCIKHQAFFTWPLLLICLVIVCYNYFILKQVLTTPKTGRDGNLIFINDEKLRIKGTRETAEKSVSVLQDHNYKFHNAAFMVEKYPSVGEFIFFVSVALMSFGLYLTLLLSNYGLADYDILRPCVDPLDTTRYYDPYNNGEQNADTPVQS